jgi:hypothetical protein
MEFQSFLDQLSRICKEYHEKSIEFKNRSLLATTLGSFVDSRELRSLLVNLMEAMPLCCRVPMKNSGVSTNMNEDLLFIPATLTNPKELRIDWRSSPPSLGLSWSTMAYAYIGGRLECRNKVLHILTPLIISYHTSDVPLSI